MKYFDYAATSPLYPEVSKLLSESYASDFANPSSLHILGHELKEKIEEKRQIFLKALGAHPQDHFYFLSSATEANNTVIAGLNLEAGTAILYSKACHSSLVAPIEFVAKEKNLKLIEVPHKSNGTIDQEKLDELINATITQTRIGLIALTTVNNQSGVVLDYLKLTGHLKQLTKAHIHLDCVQHFGKLPLKLPNANSPIDSLSLTSHKIGGPKGIAGLYVKRPNQLTALIKGGGQEHGFRSGTESYPLINAFAEAALISLKNLEEKKMKLQELSQIIKEKLSGLIPEIIFPFEQTSPYIISFILPGISSDIILRSLEVKKIYLSSTSACSSRVKGYNSSLAALQIPEEQHKNFLRVSIFHQTSVADVEVLCTELQTVWNSLKKIKR